MPEFPHLNLFQALERKPFKPSTSRKKKGRLTLYNLEHREEHVERLTSSIEELRRNWNNNLETRRAQGLPDLQDESIIPVFLQIDLSAKDIESLKSFGIDIISEEDEGYILGANADNFQKFTERLEQFLNQSNQKFKDSAASILQIIQDPNARLQKILTPSLFSKWDSLHEEREMVVYLAVSSYLKTPDYPTQGKEQTDESYELAVERWRERYRSWEIEKDDLAMARQTLLENIIAPYNAEFLGLSQYTDFDDGFGCKIRISGRGLIDLALNYPYVFNIEEHDPLEGFRGIDETERLLEIDILEPAPDAPRVCVIDSGIQEAHRLLSPAIESAISISYVPADHDTFDKVPGGGHGTRVAGALIYPTGFDNLHSPFRAPFWIQNARVLDKNNKLNNGINEVDVMKQIVHRFHPTKIFNLSVSRERTESYTHMPMWAAAIDKLIWENDILFIIAAGNIPSSSNDVNIPGISNFLQSGLDYPRYLKEEKCKITNPAHSCFALTVGSICHDEFDDGIISSIGKTSQPSSFSRCGLGLWGMIKPDVVEYGGDFVTNMNTGQNIATREKTSPQLVRSTRDGGPAVGRDIVGTSFSTPKVSHIVAALQNIYPNESALLYRALVVQSATIPVVGLNIEDYICHYGYGLPNLEKAISNSAGRVTLYATGSLSPKNADLYLVKIPNEMSRPGNDYNVLIEITLSYKAEPRITRKGTRSYLSAWLDWETSKPEESLEAFRNRILSAVDEDEDEGEGNEENTQIQAQIGEGFRWTIASRSNSGELRGIRRQDSTLQKDWCTIPAYNLPREFVIAIKGHKGWEKDLDKRVPYTIVVSFEVLDEEVDIYSMIKIENEIEVHTEVNVPV